MHVPAIRGRSFALPLSRKYDGDDFRLVVNVALPRGERIYKRKNRDSAAAEPTHRGLGPPANPPWPGSPGEDGPKAASLTGAGEPTFLLGC